MTDLGGLPDRCDEKNAASPGDDRIHERAVDSVSDGGRTRNHRSCLLGDRRGLTGQRRFIHLERMAFDQSPIRGNAIACFHEHDVAGHELFHRNIVGSSITEGARTMRDHRLERHQRAFGSMLLQKAENRIEDDHGSDQHRVLEIADDASEQGSGDQDQVQDAS